MADCGVTVPVVCLNPDGDNNNDNCGDDEYNFLKNRKHDPYDGKTIRAKTTRHRYVGLSSCSLSYANNGGNYPNPYCGRRYLKGTDNDVVTIYRKSEKGQKISFMSVSEVDLEYADGAMGSTYGLQQKHMWQGARELVEETAVSCKKNSRKCRSHAVTQYEVPVVGHILMRHDALPVVTNASKSPEELGWFKVKNQYYNHAYLHIPFHGAYKQYKEFSILNWKLFVEKLADLDAAKLSDKVDSAVKLKYDEDIIKLPMRVRMADAKRREKTDKKSDWRGEILIDLKTAIDVTHICLRSEDPTINKLVEHNKPSHNRLKQLHVIRNPYEVSWVTSYDLFYQTLDKNMGARRWIKVNNFPANNCMISQHVTDLKDFFNTEKGVYTRMLKIMPTNYHGKPVFNFCIYGKGPSRKTLLEEKNPELETIAIESFDPTGRQGFYDGWIKQGDLSFRYRDSVFGRAMRVSNFRADIKYDEVSFSRPSPHAKINVANRFAGFDVYNDEEYDNDDDDHVDDDNIVDNDAVEGEEVKDEDEDGDCDDLEEYCESVGDVDSHECSSSSSASASPSINGSSCDWTIVNPSEDGSSWTSGSWGDNSNNDNDDYDDDDNGWVSIN